MKRKKLVVWGLFLCFFCAGGQARSGDGKKVGLLQQLKRLYLSLSGRMSKVEARAEEAEREMKRLRKQMASQQKAFDSFRRLFAKEKATCIEAIQSLQRKAGKSFSVQGVEFVMRWIPAGWFLMGSPTHEQGRHEKETPQLRVRISRGFWMLESEVTQEQYKALMGSTPSGFKNCGNNCPVEQVNWEEARAFANKLSKATNLTACKATDRDIFKCVGWRLPTEAEWEYAARAGTKTATYNTATEYKILGRYNAPNLDSIAWYGGNSGVEYEGGFDCIAWVEQQYSSSKCGTYPVGRKKANAWGLKDMLGNVWEWTMDVYADSYAGLSLQDPLRSTSSNTTRRVIRGGSWDSYARDVRSASRNNSKPTFHGTNVGFRLLRY